MQFTSHNKLPPYYSLCIYITSPPPHFFTQKTSFLSPTFLMATTIIQSKENEREGAEIVYGPEECLKQSMGLLNELGFPSGVFPLKDLVECGRVKKTGFVWMKQKAPSDHFFVNMNTKVSYGTEVTACIEKSKMKKITGVKSKQILLWVPIVEMSMEDTSSDKIYFKTPMGIGKSFPVTAYMTDDEKRVYLEATKA